MNHSERNYHTHITGDKRWFELNLQEVWRYRDLIFLFVKRTFVLTYKQTILGPAWIFLNPFITSVIYTIVFGGIAGINTHNVPKILFYLCSNAIWTVFSTSVTNNATTFTSNASVFGKVYFPRLTMPISNVITSFIQFGVQMSLVMIFFVYFLVRGEVSPHWEAWPLIILVLIHLGAMGLGVGIVVSSLTTKYRDLTLLVGFAVSLWMYVTPIVYPLSELGESKMRTLLLLNPVTTPVEMFRYAILGDGAIHLGYYLLSWIFTFGILLFGIMLFNRVEKTFMDTV